MCLLRWSASLGLSGSTWVHALAPSNALVHRIASLAHFNLHDRSAEEGNQNHWQPRRHLGEAPGDIAVRDSQVVLPERAIEGVEETLIGLDLLNLVVHNQVLEGLGSCRGTVQGLVADSRNGRRLISKGLGDLEVVERGCANRPSVAKDILDFAVKVSKLGRIWLGSKNGKGSLGMCQPVVVVLGLPKHTFHALVAFAQRPKHVLLPPVTKMSQSWVVGALTVGSTVNTCFQFSRLMGCWMAEAAFAAALPAAALMGADGAAGMAEDTAAVALLKKPLTLSSSGICSSATAMAGRARRSVDEKRMVAM